MRIDLYSSRDRAAEAMAMYRDREQSKYMGWCSAGAAFTAYFFVGLLGFVSPRLLDVFPSWESRYWLTGLVLQPSGYYGGSLGLNGRVIVFWLIAAAMLFVAGLVSAKVIAFYQALVAAAMTFGLAYVVVAIAGQQFFAGSVARDDLWIVQRTISAIAGVPTFLVFAYGLLGGFLPDY
jgi:hypothetical protein